MPSPEDDDELPLPAAPPILQNRTCWRRIDSATRSTALAMCILCVNYLSGQTFLPSGNLAAIIGIQAASSGLIGSSIKTIAIIEGLVISCIVAIPVGYGLSQVSDEVYQISLPFIIFVWSMWLILTTWIAEGAKGIVGGTAFLFFFATRQSCQVSHPYTPPLDPDMCSAVLTCARPLPS